MKKSILIIAALTLMAAISYAQPKCREKCEKHEMNPEQMSEKFAQHIADELALDDAASARFIPVYKQFRMELMDINKAYAPCKCKETLSDAEVDSMLRKDFEKSQKILDLRVAYYDKFLKVISPKQIRAMYKEEREFSQKAFHGHFKMKCPDRK